MTVSVFLVIVFFLGALAVAVQGLIANELRGWLPHMSRALVRAAIRQVPEDQRERYEEEWMAELSAYADRPLTALLIACDLRRGAREIGRTRTRVSLFDRVIAAAALVTLAPLLGVTALLIKLDSRGPVFWRRARFGEDGRTILLLCFRTCRVVTHDVPCPNCGAHAMLALDAEHATRVGAVLERTSLDALPLFINVVRGQIPFLPPGTSWHDVFEAMRGR